MSSKFIKSTDWKVIADHVGVNKDDIVELWLDPSQKVKKSVVADHVKVNKDDIVDPSQKDEGMTHPK